MLKTQNPRTKRQPLSQPGKKHARRIRSRYAALRCREGSRCRFQRHATMSLEAGAVMLRSLRLLRRDLIYCAHCPLEGGCPALGDFNQLINLAIEQINAEWGHPVKGEDDAQTTF